MFLFLEFSLSLYQKVHYMTSHVLYYVSWVWISVTNDMSISNLGLYSAAYIYLISTCRMAIFDRVIRWRRSGARCCFVFISRVVGSNFFWVTQNNVYCTQCIQPGSHTSTMSSYEGARTLYVATSTCITQLSDYVDFSELRWIWLYIQTVDTKPHSIKSLPIIITIPLHQIYAWQ